MDPVLALVIIVALVCITVVAGVLTNKERGTSFLGAKLGKTTVSESQAIQVRPPAPVLQNITFKQALESDALATGLEELAKRQVEYAFGLQSANAVVRAVSLDEQREELVIAYELLRNGTSLSETGLPETGEAVMPLHRESGKFLPNAKGRRQRPAYRVCEGGSVEARELRRSAHRARSCDPRYGGAP